MAIRLSGSLGPPAPRSSGYPATPTLLATWLSRLLPASPVPVYSSTYVAAFSPAMRPKTAAFVSPVPPG
jgi:hypothetical protein